MLQSYTKNPELRTVQDFFLYEYVVFAYFFNTFTVLPSA